MNTSTNTAVRTLGLAFAALVLLALPFALAPKAHAADLDFGGDYSYDYSYPTDTGYSYDYSYPTDTGYSYDYSYPTDTGYSYDYSYDTYTPDYGYGGGYGGYSMPSFGGGGGMSQSQSQRSSNINQNVNQNTCTNGSCNTNNSSSVNAPTTIVTNYPAQQTQPVYTPVYMPSQPVYYPQQPVYQQPVAYNTRPAPYVSLSAVPYTGLDLGPWGTVAYWGFLILWCLGAAYLIVVKRVQNKLVSGLNKFLFGGPAQKHVSHKVAPVARQHVAPTAQFSGIDPFIASQIHRAAF